MGKSPVNLPFASSYLLQVKDVFAHVQLLAEYEIALS